MNKILVEVYVPALLKSFEMYIPLKSKMYVVIKLIEAAIVELSNGSYVNNPKVMICEKNTGTIYNINLTVEQLGLKNGSQLMLV
ncbi:MAG: methyltransferase [Clostridia bacterium]|nr:methyltransferase [Clostridia bacterium]